jgi:hypothetical protein
MVSTPSPPPAPDPVATAQAQTQSNRETAIANANLNRFDQYAPQGSVTYDIKGYNSDGTPQYVQNTNLNAGEQGLYETGLATRQNIGDIALRQSGRVGDELEKSPAFTNSEAEKWAFDLADKRLAPKFEQDRSALETRLANQGITYGSEAYDRAMSGFGQTRNDAYNQLALTGRAQAANEHFANRNQVFNETNALQTGSQISQPAFTPFQPVAQANTDVAGIYNNAYRNELAGYNMQNQSQNAMMGGLFNVGAAGLYGWGRSDRRLKRNIQRIGTYECGAGKYRFTYVWGGPEHIGTMADEVEKIMPDAVKYDADGFAMVDYSRVR